LYDSFTAVDLPTHVPPAVFEIPSTAAAAHEQHNEQNQEHYPSIVVVVCHYGRWCPEYMDHRWWATDRQKAAMVVG
jgi:hypothetical protein